MLGWRRWWASTGLPALRVMAVEHWDPQNIYDDASRADAYDAYLERVGRMLRRGKGAEEIARYLGDVRTKAMRLEESETRRRGVRRPRDRVVRARTSRRLAIASPGIASWGTSS